MDNTAIFLGIRLHVIEDGLCSRWMLCLFISVSSMKIIVNEEHKTTFIVVPNCFFVFFFFGTFLSFLLYFPISFIMIAYTSHLNLKKTLQKSKQSSHLKEG